MAFSQIFNGTIVRADHRGRMGHDKRDVKISLNKRIKTHIPALIVTAIDYFHLGLPATRSLKGDFRYHSM